MNCAILAIGTELLMGQITNTNATYLSRKLNELGLSVNYHYVVGDNLNRLYNLLIDGIEKCDVIIATGGLGPTQDDLTKEAIAKAYNSPLEFNEDVCNSLEQFFNSLGREMTDNNKRQAYFPEGSIILPNPKGTAPGFIIEKELDGKKKILISLPGPPRENIPMFEDQVFSYLTRYSTDEIVSMYLKFTDIGESKLEDSLIDIFSNQTNPTLATYAGGGDMCLRVTAKAKSQEEGQKLIKPVYEEIVSRLGRYIYSTKNLTLEETVANTYMDNGLTISLAESCTGGLIASKLTSVSGVSAVLNRSLVTYTNQAKVEELSVSMDTLDRHTAVSEEVALEMVRGLYNKTKSDVCLSITGIAGPTGGTEDKPVGLIYIGIKSQLGDTVKQIILHGDRNNIRNRASVVALNMLRTEGQRLIDNK